MAIKIFYADYILGSLFAVQPKSNSHPLNQAILSISANTDLASLEL